MAWIQKRERLTRKGEKRITYSVNYRDPAGRSRRKVFVRKGDAQRWLADNEATKARGAWVDPAAGRDRLAMWAERWFASTAGLRPGTRRTYRQLLDNQILPTFGPLQLASIDRLAVREWIAGLVEQGLSPSRVRNAHQVLSQILEAAVEGSRLARNPARGVKGPRRVVQEMRFLSATELERLAEAITPPYGPLVLFLGWTGLRIGEAVALRVGRLDLLAGRVEVVEAATEVGSHLAWDMPKTGERRSVPLPRFLCDALGAYLAERPHDLDDLVFTMPEGGVLRASKWADRYFKPAAVHAGLFVARRVQPATGREVVSSDLRVHDLRHTAASLAIREGAAIKLVQAMLGHKSATMTLDRYGHLYPSDLDALAARLDQARATALSAPAPALGRPVTPLRGDASS